MPTSYIATMTETDIKRVAARENQQSSYAKTKPQISCAVTAQLISAFVFAKRIVQFLLFVNPKFAASPVLVQLGLCRNC